MKCKRYNQIDILKGIAISFVILIHCFNIRNSYFITRFTISNGVPIFMIILGITYTISFKNNKCISLKECFSKIYFKRKFKRIILPYLIIYIIDISIQVIFFELKLYSKMYMGYIHLNKFGNYFFLLLIQFIIIFPLIYYYYIKKPKLTIICCIIIYIIYQISYYVIPRNYLSFEIQKICIFRDIIYIILGIWFIDKYKQERIKFLFKNKFLIYLFFISIIFLIFRNRFYIILIYFNLYKIRFISIFSIFYTFGIVIIGIIYLPKKHFNKILDFLSYIGKCSYHIYLIQLLFFGILFIVSVDFWKLKYSLILTFISFVFCFILGIIFFELDKKFINK